MKPTISITTAILMLGCSASPKNQKDAYATIDPTIQQNTQVAIKSNSKATEFISTGQYQEAETELKKALEADITYGPAHSNLGSVYYFQKNYYLAAWEFEYAAKLMPGRPEPKNNLGLVYEAVGRIDNAVEEYGKAVALGPENPELIGNLLRARIRRGDRGPDVEKLLSDLILKDQRNEWIDWANSIKPSVRGGSQNLNNL